ncbi:hypothetical protein BDV96DRAFT_638452 [Lophiotrema nucula]|uniref:Uncharacterized protein n=1 Tax=Lophiotrema nucula TaxID=690887 RepID=A0A6A5YG59_9PLEO|nr:hypothetical protein BDV96DRAFT_638452 [Lophiotrema nucula]
MAVPTGLQARLQHQQHFSQYSGISQSIRWADYYRREIGGTRWRIPIKNDSATEKSQREGSQSTQNLNTWIRNQTKYCMASSQLMKRFFYNARRTTIKLPADVIMPRPHTRDVTTSPLAASHSRSSLTEMAHSKILFVHEATRVITTRTVAALATEPTPSSLLHTTPACKPEVIVSFSVTKLEFVGEVQATERKVHPIRVAVSNDDSRWSAADRIALSNVRPILQMDGLRRKEERTESESLTALILGSDGGRVMQTEGAFVAPSSTSNLTHTYNHLTHIQAQHLIHSLPHITITSASRISTKRVISNGQPKQRAINLPKTDLDEDLQLLQDINTQVHDEPLLPLEVTTTEWKYVQICFEVAQGCARYHPREDDRFKGFWGPGHWIEATTLFRLQILPDDGVSRNAITPFHAKYRLRSIEESLISMSWLGA